MFILKTIVVRRVQQPQGHYQTLILMVRMVYLGTQLELKKHYPDIIHMSQLLWWCRKNRDFRISPSDSQCYKDELMETKMKFCEPKEHNIDMINLKYCLHPVSWKL